MKTIKIAVVTVILMITALAKAQNDPIETITSALNNSSILNHNIPSYLKNGQSYSASITMMNSGLNTWNVKNGYKLIFYTSDNGDQNDVWGVRSVSLPVNVQPFEKVTFNFQLRAPGENGRYPNRWIMAQGNQTFGESTPLIFVEVSGKQSSSDALNDAVFVHETIPSRMRSGQEHMITVTVKNTGTSSWLPSSSVKDGEYKLAIFNDPVDDVSFTNWGISSVTLSQRVDPGETHKFRFKVISPQPGTYILQLMMMHGTTYFGSKSNQAITVHGKDNKEKFKKEKKEKKEKKDKKDKKKKDDEDSDDTN